MFLLGRKNENMKYIFLAVLTAFSVLSFAIEQKMESDTLPKCSVILQPECAGSLQYEFDSLISMDSDQVFAEMDFSLEFYAGWHCIDTVIHYDEDGSPEQVVFLAEKLDVSEFQDSIVISEIFFSAYLDDSLSNWFELTNITDHVIVLEHACIQTTIGKQIVESAIELPAKSCVQLFAKDLNLQFEKDSLIFADAENRIISSVCWDASRMNFPTDSIFSLEIIDVFGATREVSNWEIIYGQGTPGQCPQAYKESLGQETIWSWLQFVVWGVAFILLIMIIGLSFKKRKLNA